MVRTERQAVAGGDVVLTINAYDKHGQLAYESDTVRLAAIHQFDLVGRELKTIYSDGTSSESSWNAWNELLESISRDASNAEISHSKNFYTFKGRLFLSNERESTSGAAALGNAVYHATGKRVRDLPITLEKVL